jgi:hypothetical protein
MGGGVPYPFRYGYHTPAPRYPSDVSDEEWAFLTP